MRDAGCTCSLCSDVDAAVPATDETSFWTPTWIVHRIRTPLAVLAANNSYLREVGRASPSDEFTSLIDDNQEAVDTICGVLQALVARR